MYSAKILADSLSPEGVRLTTFEVTYPHFVHKELLTHRMFSRNAASSRALPTEKMIEQVRHFPFIPDLNRRVKGMGVGEPLSVIEQADAVAEWDRAREAALTAAGNLLHVDKSRANRLLEPFAWTTTLVTATDWGNFFSLRTATDAQPELQKAATMMKEAYESNTPWHCSPDAWHIPLVSLEELGATPDYHFWVKVSTGRCARVSYLTHGGQRTTEDIGLHNRLLADRHLSPFEHVARPFTDEDWIIIREQQEELRGLYNDRAPQRVKAMCRGLEYSGNLRGWKSYRTDIQDEHDFSLISSAA